MASEPISKEDIPSGEIVNEAIKPGCSKVEDQDSKENAIANSPPEMQNTGKMASAEEDVDIMKAQVLNFNLSTLRSLASSMIRESENNLDGDFSQRCFSPGNFIKNQIMDLRSILYHVLIGDAMVLKKCFLLEGIDPALYQCKGLAAFNQDLINVMFTNENNNDHQLPVGVSGEEEMAYKKMLGNIIFGAENDDGSELYQLLMMGNDQSYLNSALIHAVLTCKCIGEPENEGVKKVDDSSNKPLDEELDIEEFPYFPLFGEPEKKEDKEVDDSLNRPFDEDSDIEEVSNFPQCIGEPEKKEDKEVDDSSNKPLDEESDIEELPFLLQCIGEPEKEVDDSSNMPLDEESDIEELPYPPPIAEKLELAVDETTPKNKMSFEACQVQAIVEKPELPVDTSTKREDQQFGETSPAKIMKLEKLYNIEEEIPEDETPFTGLEYELINIELLNLIRCKDAFNIEVGPDCTKEDLVKAIAEYKKAIESNLKKNEEFFSFWRSIP